MGGKACGANASSDYFHETTGVGHTDGVSQHEEDDQRAEVGLMSAMEDAGSSNIFMMQHSHQAAAPQPASKKPTYYVILPIPLPHDVAATKRGIDIILSGPGCKEHIQARMSSKQYHKKVVSVDSTGYYYPINVSLKPGNIYQIYLPRLTRQIQPQ